MRQLLRGFPVFRFIGNPCKAIGNQRSINSSAIWERRALECQHLLPRFIQASTDDEQSTFTCAGVGKDDT